MTKEDQKQKEKKIWFAGGCFWGMEALFSKIPGVLSVVSGYANGRSTTPTYEKIPFTGHAETIAVTYDQTQISLKALLCFFFRAIDPTALNRQGNDSGKQYRSGIYYEVESDFPSIREAMIREQKKYKRHLATEVGPLENFCPAEAYHQHYLGKNPQGYCHLSLERFLPKRGNWRDKSVDLPSDEMLQHTLPALSYQVMKEGETEPPFQNAYWDNEEPGIYVDILTGEPLFSSSDQFDAGCGWPSFSRPIEGAALEEKIDKRFGMVRTEVQTKKSSVHLGHVFPDGLYEAGGLRYCMNSAALRFIPCADMLYEGYGAYLPLIR